MGNKESTTIRKSTVSKKAEQALIATKDASFRRRTVQNILLIWLDSKIDDKKEDSRNTITQLRRVVNNIVTFTDGNSCVEFIKTITNNKACMVISGSLGEHIVPQIHNMSQVNSIFIFCGNIKHHKQWTKKWSKIKGIHTEIAPICEGLKQTSQQCEQNAISISFVATNDGTSSKTLDRLDPMFMYTQIIKEILLTIKFDQQHINEFIEFCRDIFHDNEEELKKVDQLKRQYHNKTPIWWYTCEEFLYPMLNRALRTSDVDIIIKMGFFISDLHRQIEQLHKEQFTGDRCNKIFTVYRGQGLLKTDFEQMIKTKGGLMSFNNFLSTSTDRSVSLNFANKTIIDPELMGILFTMTIDPSKSTTPFASINGISYYQEENEVLFSMHTVFRIHDIRLMSENQRLFQVDLKLTSDNDKDLLTLTDRIREETFPNSRGWYRLGSVLFKMGQSDSAEKVYEALLDQVTNESEKAPIYHQIGLGKCNHGDYEEAIVYYKKSLEVYKKTLPENHPDLAMSYNNIGEVYRSMNEYVQALSSYEKALEIQQQSLPVNHPDLAASYNNIGIVYQNMDEYQKALSSYEKTLEIDKNSLPLNHPNLGMDYNNIGAVYEKMRDYPKAYSFYERAVHIGQYSLPSNHPHLQTYKKNLENIKKRL